MAAVRYRRILPLVSGSESDSKPPMMARIPDVTTNEAVHAVPDAYEQMMPATRDTLLHTPNAVARTLVVYLKVASREKIWRAREQHRHDTSFRRGVAQAERAKI